MDGPEGVFPATSGLRGLLLRFLGDPSGEERESVRKGLRKHRTETSDPGKLGPGGAETGMN
eukprot:12205832-Alexandrium_andersonii.AAC.1